MKKSLQISSEIRNSFLNFFKKNDHHLVSSSSLIPKNDPSLLFTNSGMVQFKNWFTGDEKPKFKNVVTIQKCLRAGGKHNDLDNVGFTPRHHTFFEMLGNFSFGKYFKEESIEFAWKFLTQELCLNKKNLYITVFNEDKDSYRIWKNISGFSNSQILKISSEDNFWSMGEEGPCGPCSEIFFDNGEKLQGGLPGTKNQDGERFVEIWNLVFMEYKKLNGKLCKLPTKCVDTGMGLERITAVLSKKSNNFDTDLFDYLFKEIEIILDIKFNSRLQSSFKIISDHIRAIVFLISEGILPSNEGRGYVLRRIIRRALMHVHKIKPNTIMLHDLVDVVVEKYSDVYFEIKKSSPFIKKNLKNEEDKFSETLETGINLLKKEISELKKNSFPPETAFKLYDTFGFPIDMTSSILKEKKITLDVKKYDQIVLEHKKNQKSSWTGSGEIKQKKIFSDLKNGIKSTTFVGYNTHETKAKLLKILYKDNLVNSLDKESQNSILIFDSTPFYAESGGQVGDIGLIFNMNKELVGKVKDTQKIEDNIFLHFMDKSELKIETDKEYYLQIDLLRRKRIRNNHSATHLLHESLRRIVGDHVSQRGSLVNEVKLRFDYSSNAALKDSEILNIETIVNNSIRSNLKTVIKKQSLKDALDSGAIALFGEKYPDNVRVVSMISNDKKNNLSSIELCGGTHVEYTGEIGSFKILGDSSIASGIRRVEAVTGEEVYNFNRKKLRILEEIKVLMKASDENVIEKISSLKIDYNNLKKSSSEQKSTFSENNIIRLKNTNIYFQELKCSPKELKNFCDQIKKNLKSGITIIFTIVDKKISIVVSLTEDLINEYDSVKILKKIIEFLGGKGGGGRQDMAQGGANFSMELNSLKKFVSNLLDS